MPVTIKDIEHIAKLGRVELKEEQKKDFASQLDSIIGYINKLNTLKTDDIPATSHALSEETMLVRDDIQTPSLKNEEALHNAPDKEGKFFKVKKVIE